MAFTRRVLPDSCPRLRVGKRLGKRFCYDFIGCLRDPS